MLVATTTHITQTIAPVPLLWIVPLAMYLATFAVAFRGWGESLYIPLLFLFSAVAAYWYTPSAYEDLVIQTGTYLALLFFCGLACHALLYRMRPPAEFSPDFYVFLSLGGALGTLSASILPPLVFSDYWEFPLGLALSAAFATLILPKTFFPRILDTHAISITKAFFLVLVFSLLVRHLMPQETIPSISMRNFYGNTKVIFESDVISLMHGTTLHGMQYAHAEDARLPTTYYTPSSGIGRAILFEQEVRGSKDVRVGTIGLGTGSIAAYCRPDDAYVFYEIDSRIEGIARSYFSYLSHCKDSEVRIGDGRLLLEAERTEGDSGEYDVFAVDAFSDDTIPVHLLTLEAFETYLSRLRSSKSILAIHISNRYLDLGPIVFRIAAELGVNAMIVSDSGESYPGGSYSSWVVLTRDLDVLRSVNFANTDSFVPEPAPYAWTDDYSSLVPVLDIPKPWEDL